MDKWRQISGSWNGKALRSGLSKPGVLDEILIRNFLVRNLRYGRYEPEGGTVCQCVSGTGALRYYLTEEREREPYIVWNVELLDQIALQEHTDGGTTRVFV